jgi:hypothetical protein
MTMTMTTTTTRMGTVMRIATMRGRKQGKSRSRRKGRWCLDVEVDHQTKANKAVGKKKKRAATKKSAAEAQAEDEEMDVDESDLTDLE